MSGTIADFVAEAEIYQYSKECFETLKECGEIELMTMYAQAADYLSENTAFPAELLDTLIVEAAEIQPELKEKMKNHAGKIIKKVVRLASLTGRAIFFFFKNVLKVFNDERNNREKIIRLFRNIKASMKTPDGIRRQQVENLKAKVEGITDDLVMETLRGMDTEKSVIITRIRKDEFILELEGTYARLRTVDERLYKDLIKTINWISAEYTISAPEITTSIGKISGDFAAFMTDLNRMLENGGTERDVAAMLEKRITKLKKELQDASRYTEQTVSIKVFQDICNDLAKNIPETETELKRLGNIIDNPRAISVIGAIAPRLFNLFKLYQQSCAICIKRFADFMNKRKRAFALHEYVLSVIASWNE